MILSFEEARMDTLFSGLGHPFSARQVGELVWLIAQQNILEFLKAVPPSRQHRVRFEELVDRPEGVLADVCRFLGVAYHPGMAEPYGDRKSRMTDGTRMLGDVKFHQHKAIDPATAGRWAGRIAESSLGDVTWQMAESLGYPRPHREPNAIRPARRRAAAVQVEKASDAEVDRMLARLLSKDKGES
jgi:hypothetical protein